MRMESVPVWSSRTQGAGQGCVIRMQIRHVGWSKQDTVGSGPGRGASYSVRLLGLALAHTALQYFGLLAGIRGNLALLV